MSIDETIFQVIREILEQKQGTPRDVTHDKSLSGDLSFESLDIAQLVATLEMKLGVDPFATHVTIAAVRTVGDLCAAYRSCIAGQGS